MRSQSEHYFPEYQFPDAHQVGVQNGVGQRERALLEEDLVNPDK